MKRSEIRDRSIRPHPPPRITLRFIRATGLSLNRAQEMTMIIGFSRVLLRIFVE
jgi:hypothetical protein